MNDLDLEDIESHLYSQVYHSVASENDLIVPQVAPEPENPTNGMRKPGRYFGTSPKLHKTVSTKHALPPGYQDYDRPQGFYSKNYNRRHAPDIAINQLVVLSPQRPILYMNSRQRQRARWLARQKEKKRKNQTVREAKQSRNLLEKRAGKEPQHVRFSDKQVGVTETVITLSDSESEGESCVLIPDDWPVLSICDSEDDEKKTLEKTTNVKNEERINVSASDDVIFVEPVTKPVEVISLDEELQGAEKSVNKTETASVTSSDHSSITESPLKQAHKERKELLNTPDSASNDFVNSSGVELNQPFKFNFSLHGADFKNGDFVKPASRNETCETESSSSTTDANSINLMKTAVFNEIEFPKDDIFSESNLESFGKFITPVKSRANVSNIQSSPLPVADVQKPAYSSDSSSESDFEQVGKVKKSKNLPELSPMQTKNDVTKKLKTITSKYDLIDAEGDESVKKQKKKQKNKKRKSEIDENASDESSGHKRRRSSQIDETSDNLAKKKEKKNKKKTSSTSRDLEEEITQSTEESELIPEKNKDEVRENAVDEKKKLKNKKKTSSVCRDAEEEISRNTEESELISEKNKDEVRENDAEEKKKLKNKKKTSSVCRDTEEEISRNTEESGLISEKNKDEVRENDAEEKKKLKNKKKTSSVCRDPEEEITQNTEESESIPQKIEAQEKKTVVVEYSEAVFTKVPADQDPSPLEGLVVIDETFSNTTGDHIVSSDSESVLSPLSENNADIQLNCEVSVESEHTPSTSRSGDLNLNLSRCSVEDLQANMSNDPSRWRILESDLYPIDKPAGRRRCNKCKELGHMAIRCPNKIYPKCKLCGQNGHFEPRCPNRLCTQCGRKSLYSTNYCSSCFKLRDVKCKLCYMTGHTASCCPDLWRRYYLTVTVGPLNRYEGPPLRQKKDLWCSGCARPGHLEHSCRSYKSAYPATDPYIKSFEDVYKERNEQFTRQQVNYVPHQNYLMQEYDQRFNYNFNYNHFANSLVQNGLFVANQQNFFTNQFARDFINSYAGCSNQFTFNDDLPGYISFESPRPQNNFNQVSFQQPQNNLNEVSFQHPQNNLNEVSFQHSQNNFNEVPLPELNEAELITSEKTYRNSKFLNMPLQSLQNFISQELVKLTKMSVRMANNSKELRELKKRQEPIDPKADPGYYKMLNMLLLGIHHFHRGKNHLEVLRQFKRERIPEYTSKKRKSLRRAYYYIFGSDKHSGIDYNELLRRI